jgi:DNA topoisomerase VI B subunit
VEGVEKISKWVRDRRPARHDATWTTTSALAASGARYQYIELEVRMPPKKASMASTASGKGDKNLTQKSPAEFFQDNKGIAGFENAGKSLYTTLREFIENSLDSAEAIGTLPEIDITVEEVSVSQYERLIGLKAHVRLDDELYADFESEKAKAKRLAQEARKAKAAEKSGKRGGGGGGKREQAKCFYKITVQDNGKGMNHEDIPNMLGRVLSGTKYGVRQTRGKFGLGSKMALIWSKQTTGLPISIRSAQPNQSFVSEYELDIDIEKNEPNIHKEAKVPNDDKWHGATLSVTIEGNWTTYRQYVLSYLRQLAIVTPYAQLRFRFITSAATTSSAKDIDILFRRRTDIMPALPSITKHHPTAAKENMLLIKDLLSQTREKNLVNFLHKEFTCINKDLSIRLIQELGYGFDTDMHPSEVTDKQATRIQQLLADARFDDPDGSCLSPAGEYNLRLGIMKELGPEWIASFCAPALACGGHPLIVEACVSLGGREVKPGFNVFRFANRIPLLFEGGNDVVTRCVQRLNWSTYKIDKNNDKIGVFVSIVSTKIPFKGTSKEYIGDENNEIAEAVDKAIKQCALQLRGKIVRAQVARDRKARKKQLVKYIPDVARAVFAMLAAAADADQPPSKRARIGAALWNIDEKWESNVLEQAREGEVSEKVLISKLEEHVQRSDHEQALEFAMQNSKDGLNEHLYLTPKTPAHEYVHEIRNSVCAFRLLKASEMR